MKRIIINILQGLARRVLRKYHPKVIGITGSVGKTATKEAVFAVLAKKFSARKNIKNYNTEIGLPLTIIGARVPGRSIIRWMSVLLKGLVLLLLKRPYPAMLVLEMGADKAGDIDELVSIARPDVAIITAIAPVHTKQFGSIAGVAKEKAKLFAAVKEGGWLVVNVDDDRVVRAAKGSSAEQVTFGIQHADAQVRASEISVSRSNKVATGIMGMSCKLITNGTVTPVILRGEIGRHRVYPALAAAAVARIYGIHMVDVAEALSGLAGVAGRMRVLPGIKHTVLVDDTYNASPSAMKCAIEALSELDVDGRKYAVLGDMLELGAISEAEHRAIGKLVSSLHIDVLITVGERSQDIARGAKDAGMPEDRIVSFGATGEAGLFVQRKMEQGDVVLAKGSRGMHMERIVKEIMAEPERARELLVS